MDKVLKQRLIGASILIALAVIFVPMLFEGPAPDAGSRELSIDLPSPPDNRAPVRRLPLDPTQSRSDTDDSRDSSLASEGNSPDMLRDAPGETRIEPPRIESAPERRTIQDDVVADADSIESGSPDAEPSDPDSTATNSEPAQTAAGESATSPTSVGVVEAPEPANETRGFEVQVASFSARQNAESLLDRLTRLGHVASIDLLVRGPSELHRVRTGPYADRSDAERALSQIRQTLSDMEPVIVGSSLTDMPERDQSSGFAVQVGSFASRNNAVRLLGQLQGQGFDAFVHQDMAGSRTIWRVRVGPLGTRDQAVERLARMTEEDGIDGLVVSHP